MSFDEFLVKYHKDKIKRYKKRFLNNYKGLGVTESDNKERAFRAFLYRVDYWQANIPYDTLETLFQETIFEKEVREYDLVDGSVGETCDFYKDLYHIYVTSVNKEIYDNGLSFIFYGYNEAGKTFSAIHALASAIESGMSGYYIHFKDLLNLYNNAEFGRETDEVILFRHILDCDFLVVDEIGKESSVTENVLGVFEKVIKYRDEEALPTILVTNVPFAVQRGSDTQTFKQRYGNSIYNCLIKRYRAFWFSKKGRFRQRTRKEWNI